jgi:phosphatidylserine/phosphatidylglycerophosphate/cardiolipin synthase-like enzyme
MGFDVVTRFKIQNNVHNKGIVVDTKKVLVSSQNWSSAGVLDNRDAGVIVECGPVAAYFEKIFLHDWNTLSEHKLGA